MENASDDKAAAIKLIPVASSNVQAVGYDPESQTMHVQFRGGATYAHQPITPDEHEQFTSAESIGRHYNQNFRGKHTGKVEP